MWNGYICGAATAHSGGSVRAGGLSGQWVHSGLCAPWEMDHGADGADAPTNRRAAAQAGEQQRRASFGDGTEAPWDRGALSALWGDLIIPLFKQFRHPYNLYCYLPYDASI